MDQKTFWNIIEKAKQKSSGNLEHQVILIEAYLWNFSLGEIEIFYRIYLAFRHLVASNERLEIEISELMGLFDDSFDYFQAWLIAQGEDIFCKVVKDPAQLRKILRGDCMLEDLDYVAKRVYEARLGKDWWDIPGNSDAELYHITDYEWLYSDDSEGKQY